MRQSWLVPLRGWSRFGLAGVVLGLGAVYLLAWRLHPWETSGLPKRWGTHEQLGLAPCWFQAQTGQPCPTCGMTTSFCFVVRGEWRLAWAAHPGGCVLAPLGLVLALVGATAVVAGRWPNGLSDDRWLLAGLILVLLAVLTPWAWRSVNALLVDRSWDESQGKPQCVCGTKAWAWCSWQRGPWASLAAIPSASSPLPPT